MKIVVVTGGIGSGKSAVCRILQARGIPVYDCDSSVKRLYGIHPELRAMVSDGLFSHPEQLARLEDALYPVLMGDFISWAGQLHSEYVAFESAVVLQKPYFTGFGDYVLWVDAPLDLRKKRVMSRGGISATSLTERLALQSDESGNPRVFRTILNDGSINALEKQTDEFLKDINYVKREN